MKIRRYNAQGDCPGLFGMISAEGEEWMDYWGKGGRKSYAKALADCIVYVAEESGEICGYARCREDFGFGVYIYDLLVRPSHRGKGIGRMLMEKACADFPGQPVYVMSDVDGYYGGKLGYRREGSLFIVRKPRKGSRRG